MSNKDEMYEELAALLAVDALDADEQADAELRFGTFPAGLVDVAGSLAEVTQAAPPPSLKAETLARARSRRAPGPAAGGVAPCTIAESFDRTIADFSELISGLNEREWLAHAHEDHGSVRELVAHLIGMERFCAAWLDPSAPPPVDPSIEHVASTRSTVAELADTPGPALAMLWHEAVLAVVAAARAADRDRRVTFHDITASVDGLLVMRTFELWAHGMDIAYATGRALPMLDDERMALLSRRLMGSIPNALGYRRTIAPGRTARIVLTGPAGGTYSVALDPREKAGTPDVTIVADAAALCRVAARRLRPSELDATVEGDQALADLVLAGVDAFARD